MGLRLTLCSRFGWRPKSAWARALKYCKVEIDAATTPIHRVTSTAKEKGFVGPVHRRREHKPLYDNWQIKTREVLFLNKKDIAFLSVRLAAIYVFIMTLNWLAVGSYQVIVDLFLTSSAKGNYSKVIIGLIPVVILIIGGVLLWGLAKQISNYLTVKTKENQDEDVEKIELKDIQVIAFSVVGLILLVNAIPEFIYRLSNLIAIANTGAFGDMRNKIGLYLPILRDSIKLIIGFSLFFGAKGLLA
jgi:hypothetical protein